MVLLAGCARAVNPFPAIALRTGSGSPGAGCALGPCASAGYAVTSIAARPHLRAQEVGMRSKMGVCLKLSSKEQCGILLTPRKPRKPRQCRRHGANCGVSKQGRRYPENSGTPAANAAALFQTGHTSGDIHNEAAHTETLATTFSALGSSAQACSASSCCGEAVDTSSAADPCSVDALPLSLLSLSAPSDTPLSEL